MHSIDYMMLAAYLASMLGMAWSIMMLWMSFSYTMELTSAYGYLERRYELKALTTLTIVPVNISL